MKTVLKKHDKKKRLDIAPKRAGHQDRTNVRTTIIRWLRHRLWESITHNVKCTSSDYLSTALNIHVIFKYYYYYKTCYYVSEIPIHARCRTLNWGRLFYVVDGVHSTEESNHVAADCDIKYRRSCSRKCPSNCRTATHCFVCTDDRTTVLQSWAIHRRLHATRLK